MSLLKPCLLMTALALAGCSGLPLGTAQELDGIDPLHTDASAVRFAFDIPEGLKPRGVEATLSLRNAEGQEIEHQVIPLEPVSNLPEPGALPAYRLAEADMARFERFRARARVEKPQGAQGSIGVELKLCHAGTTPPNRAPVGIWLRTAETVRYVPLHRRVNVIASLDTAERAEALPPCEG